MTTWSMLTNHYGEMREPYTAVVTLCDLLLYFVLIANVGRARGRYKVDAPATDGPPGFRRAYRIHMNTLEQLALQLPLLWLSALSVGDRFAAIAGIVWLLGRIIYIRDYLRDPKSRTPGFALCMFANFVMFVGSAWGVIGSF